MSVKTFFVLAITFAIATGLVIPDAEAGRKTRRIIEGIAIGIAATALARSAASSANAHRDKDVYGYHYGLGKRENAVAACIHRAEKIVRRAGGLYVVLNRVKRVDHIGSGKFRVVAKMTGVYSWGRKRSKVWCTVKHNHVRRFRFN